MVLQFWPSWTLIPVVLGIFLAGQAISDYVLSPYLIASRVQLNPVWVMFAIAAFGYLFGFVGLLIAVPLAASIGVKRGRPILRYPLFPSWSLTRSVAWMTSLLHRVQDPLEIVGLGSL